MSGFSAIDLSRLPPPDVIRALDPDALVEQIKATVRAEAPELAPVLELESEPITKLVQVVAYYVVLVRGQVNDDGRALMLATAGGADLDNLGALFSVERQVVTPADPEALPPVAAVMEDDDRLRRRIQLAPEAFSTAGSRGAYLFHTLAADTTIRDAGIDNPVPGVVRVTLLSSLGDGAADAAMQARVVAALSAETVRPVSDTLQVQSATIVPYAITATLTVYPGPDAGVVRAAAEEAAVAYAIARHRVGQDVTRSGVLAALHRPGVQNVELTSPAADIVIAPTEAAWCNDITLTDGGTDV